MPAGLIASIWTRTMAQSSHSETGTEPQGNQQIGLLHPKGHRITEGHPIEEKHSSGSSVRAHISASLCGQCPSSQGKASPHRPAVVCCGWGPTENCSARAHGCTRSWPRPASWAGAPAWLRPLLAKAPCPSPCPTRYSSES